jgi:hypothetical protein
MFVGYGNIMMRAGRGVSDPHPGPRHDATSRVGRRHAMTAQNHILSAPYFHPDDPAGYLKPGESLAVGGLDWAWCFVWFKDIDGFPGYCVGSNGSIWSRWFGRGMHSFLSWDWRPRKQMHGRYGRLRVTLSREGRHCVRYVHRLVIESFFGPCPPGREACHNNGDHTDNRLSNLRWDTHANNVLDQFRHGTTA